MCEEIFIVLGGKVNSAIYVLIVLLLEIRKECFAINIK